MIRNNRFTRTAATATSAAALLLGLSVLATPAQADTLSKSEHGTTTASYCSPRVPYSIGNTYGQIGHKSPGGTYRFYSSTGWTTRGYYGPGGTWKVEVNEQYYSLVNETNTYGTCRSV